MSRDGQWFLIQCKPRDSFRAEMHLRNQKYDCFHPTYPVKKKVAGSIRMSIEPLFPYYLFVKLNDFSNWTSVRSTRGVSRIVSFNGMPAAVPLPIVEGLKFQCAKLNGQEPEPLFKCGDRVIITDGCFKELEAIVTATKDEERVILLLQLFNREQHIELPVESLIAC